MADTGEDLVLGPIVAPTADPEFVRLLALASEHETAGRLGEAEALLNRILAESPDRPHAVHLLGVVLFRSGRRVEGVEHVERAISLVPNEALYHRNLCEMCRKLLRYDDALAAGRRALELTPGDGHASHNLSVLHYHRLELDASIACAEASLAIDPTMPGAHFAIAEASLLSGDLARGWEEYEWRFKLGNAPPMMPPTDRPQWNGLKLPAGKTLLLVGDQGYGDVIQFSRYIAWAADRCAEIVVACARELHPVIAQQPGIARIFDRWDDQPDFAAWCPLSGLPRLAGTRVETIPADIPYLRADAGRAAAWAERLNAMLPKGLRRIGIAWAGRPTHANDDNRSADLDRLAALGELPGVALVSLQKGPAQAQAGQYWGRAPLLNLGPEIGNFGDTMAVIDGLDLVVTVDTSVGHLAGAMGKPVWIMLPHAPDWRWLLGRDDSPWYPTVRLFRQPAPGDWKSVIADVTAELARKDPGKR